MNKKIAYRSIFELGQIDKKKAVNNHKNCYIKKGDKVIVTAGSDKGKQSTVLEVDRKKGLIKVDGVRYQTHFVKGSATPVKRLGFIHISNVMLIDPATNKPTRVKILEGNRVAVKSNEEV